jgi:hypothetical protein
VKPSLRWACLLSLVGAAACSDINNHLLEGQEYYAPGECLSPQEVIDDLPGADPGDNCTPECLIVPETSNSPTAVYITTTCPPYTANYPTAELQDAAKDAADPCVGAFAAYYADGGGAICTSFEGGVVEASVDAAKDGGDATVEAAAEAAADGGVDATGQ